MLLTKLSDFSKRKGYVMLDQWGPIGVREFATPVPDSRFCLWRFGTLTDRHATCPSGITVAAGPDNELYVPEACGRVGVFDPGFAVRPVRSDCVN